MLQNLRGDVEGRPTLQQPGQPQSISLSIRRKGASMDTGLNFFTCPPHGFSNVILFL